MRPLIQWHDPGLPEKDGVKNSVYSMDFSSDGELLVVACANLVLLYNTVDGDLLHRLKGHKDTVYSVNFRRDGQRFASGGADKVVIIWSRKGEGVLKYTHNDAIQAVAFNPVTDMLASCTAVDFGLWSKEQKSVSKHPVSPRILSAAWSNDGHILALGHENGKISFRDRRGTETLRIERNAPIWCLAWAPPAYRTSGQTNEGEVGEVLAVGCWDQTLSFYLADGTQHLKDRKLHFYPCSLSYFADGDYIVIGGSDRRATLCTKEAVRLCTVCEKAEWVWSVGAQPWMLTHSSTHQGMKPVKVAVGCYAGTISMYELNFGLVHSLYQDRYAYRSNMTDVVVTHVPTDRTVRIKCRDYVRKVAVYRNRLAVQLPDRINIWELHNVQSDDAKGRGVDMHYRMRKEKIYTNANCRELIVLSQHVVLCHERKLQLCAFTCGSAHRKEREWILDSDVVCVRVDGGAAGREGLVLGLSDGRVIKIYIDNPFPIELVKADKSVVGLAVSCKRSRLAVIDSDQKMVVYELQARHQATEDKQRNEEEDPMLGRVGRRGQKKQQTDRDQELAMEMAQAAASAVVYSGNGRVLFSEPGVTSAMFNDEMDDMLAFTTSTQTLTVKIGEFVAHSQPCEGTCVGFPGGRVYTLCGDKLEISSTTMEAEQSEMEANEKRKTKDKKPVQHTITEGSLLATSALAVADIPLTNALQHHMDKQEWDKAYSIALKGVTVSDWKRLGLQAASNLALDVARKAFVRVHDLPFLELIQSLEQRTSYRGQLTEEEKGVFQAEVMAYQGQYQDAAKVFGRGGQVDRAVNMFADLRLWEEAKIFAASSNTIDARELVHRQAEWYEDVSEWAKAAEMYVTAGDTDKAVRLLGERQPQGWAEQLGGIARDMAVNDSNRSILMLSAKHLADAGEDTLAKQVYTKLDAVHDLMALYIKRRKWPEAVALADDPMNDGKFDASMFLPYAEWLAAEHRFDEALKAFRRAQRSDRAKAMMEALTFNAVVQNRFKDAAYYYRMLANELVKQHATNATAQSIRMAEAKDGSSLKKWSQQARHGTVSRLSETGRHLLRVPTHREPLPAFTSSQPEANFQVALFLLNTLSEKGQPPVPHGVSTLRILYTLAKNAKELQAYKLARLAYDRLQLLVVPDRERERMEIDMMAIQAKPVRDVPELLPVCFLSGATNPLLNHLNTGDVSISCGHPFIRSFVTFEVLPLVEFVPAPGITDEEAIDLIRTPDTNMRRRLPGQRSGYDEKDDDEDPAIGAIGSGGVDLFNNAVNRTLSLFEGHTQQQDVKAEGEAHQYVPIICDADCLLALKRDEIFVMKSRLEVALSEHPNATQILQSFDRSNAKGTVTYSSDGRGIQYCRYFRNMLPDSCPIALSQPAGRFFLEEEFEFSLLKEGTCPLTKLTSEQIGEYGHT